MQYEIGIIGGGPGGYVAAIKAAQKGAKVILFEKEKLGGTCVNWGCVPTKSLLKTASVIKDIQNAELFGITGIEKEKITIDFSKVVSRKTGIVESLVKGIEGLLKIGKVELVREWASVKEPGLVVTQTGRTVKCSKIILATGSEALLPPIQGLQEAVKEGFAITNKEALDMVEPPGTIGIVGGGVIGVELAMAYAAMGAKVHVYEAMDKILPPIDSDISNVVQKKMLAQGIEIKVGAKVERINPKGVEFTVSGKSSSENLDKLIIAVGRSPNIKGLESLGIVEKNRIPVNSRLETSLNGVYAIGDCNGTYQLAHVASAEGICAVRNAMGEDIKMNYSTVPVCIYTMPEIASVGITEENAKSRGIEYKVGKFPLAFNSKAKIEGEPDGFVKVLADPRYENILGIHLVGKSVSEMVFGIGVAIGAELTIEDITNTIFPHPSISESIVEACLGVFGAPIHS